MDLEGCSICNMSGMVTQCTLCERGFHWYCVDPLNQPTAGDWHCKDCREILNAEPPPWDNSIPWRKCVICFEDKPPTQFPQEMIPSCACPGADNSTCALCVYKIVDGSGGDIERCKCPTCCIQWTHMRIPDCGGVNGEVVALEYQSEQAPMDAPTADDGVEEGRADAHDANYVPQAQGSREADDSEEDDYDDDDHDMDYVPRVTRVARVPQAQGGREADDSEGEYDDDDEEEEDDDDGLVGDDSNVVESRRTPDSSTRRRQRGPKKSIQKRSSNGTSAASAARVIHVFLPPTTNTGDAAVATAVGGGGKKKKRPSNGKPISRCMGAVAKKLDKLNDLGKKLINDLLDKYPDLGNPDETNPDIVAADCKVLMLKDLYDHGKDSDGLAAKYPRAIKKLMQAKNGFARLAEFDDSERSASRASSIATTVAKAANAQKASIDKLQKEYKGAYNTYILVRKLLREGHLNYDRVP